MLKLGSVRFRAKCARHPKFNPAREGLAAIRGACPKCHLLLDIFEMHQRLVGLMRQAVPPRETPAKASGASGNQLPLFSSDVEPAAAAGD